MIDRRAVQNLLKSREILYLCSRDLEAVGVGNFGANIEAIESAYRAHAARDVRMPMAEYLKYPDRPSYDRIIPLLGYLGGSFGISGLKQICSSTSNAAKGYDRASGLIILNEPESNRPFAILEGARVSAVRTAAVTALAVRHFAPPELARVAFVGAGQLARTHLEMWHQLHASKLATLIVYDQKSELADRLVTEARALGLRAETAPSAEVAIRGADVVVPMTTSEQPYIDSGWIKTPSLFAAVSLLDPKPEVLLDSDAIIVDDERLCKHEGRPLEVLEKQGRLDGRRLLEVGQWLAGERQIPSGARRIFFNPMGTVITDLCIAARVFSDASARNLGIRLPI
ncbi:MAG TPA: hypothetical protein VER96_11785 [Polyangiaceae bacterium]|nr:hypothetical protein [Polyangiaceae bacterium]